MLVVEVSDVERDGRRSQSVQEARRVRAGVEADGDAREGSCEDWKRIVVSREDVMFLLLGFTSKGPSSPSVVS